MIRNRRFISFTQKAMSVVFSLFLMQVPDCVLAAAVAYDIAPDRIPGGISLRDLLGTAPVTDPAAIDEIIKTLALPEDPATVSAIDLSDSGQVTVTRTEDTPSGGGAEAETAAPAAASGTIGPTQREEGRTTSETSYDWTTVPPKATITTSGLIGRYSTATGELEETQTITGSALRVFDGDRFVDVSADQHQSVVRNDGSTSDSDSHTAYVDANGKALALLLNGEAVGSATQAIQTVHSLSNGADGSVQEQDAYNHLTRQAGSFRVANGEFKGHITSGDGSEVDLYGEIHQSWFLGADGKLDMTGWQRSYTSGEDAAGRPIGSFAYANQDFIKGEVQPSYESNIQMRGDDALANAAPNVHEDWQFAPPWMDDVLGT